MKTIYDVQQLLKRFGIVVYIGNRTADLQAMELELRDLYDAQLLDQNDYQMARLLLRKHIAIEKEKEQENES